MKKILIFSLFLLSLVFCSVPATSSANAEIAGFSASISAKVANSSANQFTETDKFSTLTNTFNADYAYFIDSGAICFSASLTPDGDNNASIMPVYEWKTSSGTIVSTSSDLVLKKTISSPTDPMIIIGESRYVCTITNLADGSFEEVGVTVKITDSNTCKMQTFSSNIPESVTKLNSILSFFAKLPIASGTTINWYLKTPNSTEFSLVLSNSETFDFEPASLINAQNGYGKYQIMAIGNNKNTNQYYYGKIYSIFGTTPNPDFAETKYNISSKIVENTKANIEAFKYTLTNIQNLNPDQIYWYINNTRMSSGTTFTYEPQATDAYKIIAKYKNDDGTIIELDTIKQEPKVTGTYILFIYIGAGVLALTIIFSISIIVTNKKRDVVW